MKVNSDFSGDWMREFDGLIGPMLEDGVSVLIYGEKERERERFSRLLCSPCPIGCGKSDRQLTVSCTVVTCGNERKCPTCVNTHSAISLFSLLLFSLTRVITGTFIYFALVCTLKAP